jgi:hypothetical protein
MEHGLLERKSMIPSPLCRIGALMMACVGLIGCNSDRIEGKRVPGDVRSAQPYLLPSGSVELTGVAGRLDHLAADPESARLFIAALENHSLEVVDLRRKARIREIAGIKEPQGLLFVPGFNRLIVCSRGDGTCRTFDASTFEEGPWVDLGRNADNVRFDAGLNVVYAGSGAEPGPGLMTGMDLASLIPAGQGGNPAPPRSKADLLMDRPRQADIKTEITLEAHPESFQIDAKTHRIFANVPDEHQIAVIEVQTNGLSVLAKWPVTAAEKNFPMALDTSSSRLFAVCRKPACVLVYDTDSGRLLSQTPCVGDSDDVYFDAEAKRLYVIGGEGFVDVFNIASKAEAPSLLARIPTAPKARTGLFIPGLRTLAVVVPRTDNAAAVVRLFRAAR